MYISSTEKLSPAIKWIAAAAAYPELPGWCKFVGEWVTELAFLPLSAEEITILLFHVEVLCNIVPELWHTCGRAQAGLKAALGV
ncbi:hypothetical protein CFter6_2858 [Collimonas fungivorans]|uniref:Uncharacterized protein n=1 Tax=Collimonas fungivorans TaxID=158899 RepID=A0A127PD29_9BURK|nr:hypothetical protein CFter6_2858 [Collimonas fungivorans]